ncbi:DUF938 domain-containing protein [Ruegeria sp.]|uniref:DUF938 domain-containing protein n=1 Tax=Ruegeria sp. TaxID=1879320 RepID=UPI002320EC2C|nr:DUF938 domain-containing protein [Ruegeria sp.]MDA7963956.1 class I SAM-dependent methyltransferase [Ruegeria sp.]
MSKRQLPPNASVASEIDNGRLIAPAASRNVDALCALVQRIAPAHGNALELASGTGQHVASFARALPDMHWHPTEIDPGRRASIDAYTADLPNVSRAAHLDATQSGWHTGFEGFDLIVLINLLHLIDWTEAQTLISEAALALRPTGRLILYGPFMRSGQLTSDGDRRFHQALIQQDPDIGYKSDNRILALLTGNGLEMAEQIEMPANNLAFVARTRAS